MTASTGKETDAVPVHPLVARGKLATITDAGKYAVLIEVVVLAIVIANALYREMTLDPLFIPLASFMGIVLGITLVVNIQVIAFNQAKLPHHINERQKMVVIEKALGSARILTGLFVFLTILFGLPLLQDVIDSQLVVEQRSPVAGRELYMFTVGDPLGLTTIDEIQVDVRTSGAINVSLWRRSVFDSGSGLPVREATIQGGAQFSYPVPLEQGNYVIVVDNLVPAGGDADVGYYLNRHIDRPFFNLLAVFCTLLGVVNGVSLGLQYRNRERVITEYVEKQRRKLELKYTIEEVFLIYRDGRLIAHNSRRLKPDVDKDILTGMLTAVQNFVKESFQGQAADGTLNELKYANLKILMENGPDCNIAIVVAGEDPPDLREKVKAALAEVQRGYGKILIHWDGEVTQWSGVKDILAKLVPARPAQTAIEEIFLVHRDQRFIMHVTQRVGPDVDTEKLEDTIAYVLDEVNKASETHAPFLYDLPIGGWKIMLEYGPYAYCAVVISGAEPGYLREAMIAILAQVTRTYGPELAQWNGQTEAMSGLRELLERLFIEVPMSGRKVHRR